MTEITHTITHADLQCLEHVRNVGQFVNEVAHILECYAVPSDPAQQLRLTSVIYLMTTQLDGVVERCNERWMNEEVRP
ncbi:hypothetical protein [Pseudescherichia sp.]|uniref:hypothetical protein n=1 Tax=Pseudescherichia sp. TaxID=2055881 RepID=UPI0039170CEC